METEPSPASHSTTTRNAFDNDESSDAYVFQTNCGVTNSATDETYGRPGWLITMPQITGLNTRSFNGGPNVPAPTRNINLMLFPGTWPQARSLKQVLWDYPHIESRRVEDIYNHLPAQRRWGSGRASRYDGRTGPQLPGDYPAVGPRSAKKKRGDCRTRRMRQLAWRRRPNLNEWTSHYRLNTVASKSASDTTTDSSWQRNYYTVELRETHGGGLTRQCHRGLERVRSPRRHVSFKAPA